MAGWPAGRPAGRLDSHESLRMEHRRGQKSIRFPLVKKRSRLLCLVSFLRLDDSLPHPTPPRSQLEGALKVPPERSLFGAPF